MLPGNHWPRLYPAAQLKSIDLIWPEHACTDWLMSQFMHETHAALWLASCWPAFKDHTLDVIAGGVEAWLIGNETKAGTHHHLNIDTHLAKTLKTADKHISDTLPIDWMAQQLMPALGDEAQPGWYGGIGYSYRPGLNGLKNQLKSSGHWPSLQLAFASWTLTLDHQQRTARLVWIDTADGDCQHQQLQALWHKLSLQGAQLACSTLMPVSLKPWQAAMSTAQYRQAFARVQQHIDAGDTYQVNLTQGFTAQFTGDPLQGFIKTKQGNPSPYAAFFRSKFGDVSCHSPELLLHIQDQPYRACTKPIKGTTARCSNTSDDQQAAQGLQHSVKNRAENTMIVDLLRNDLSKNALPGTMQVKALCALESYTHIHHLVSQIETQLKPKVHPFKVILDCFPGGSITGAPKRRAMEIINALEVTARDIYCGSIGFWDQPQRSIFNIAIRTFLFHCAQSQVKIWAGGGLVKDSNVDEEYQECFDKVEKLMAIMAAQTHTHTHT